MSTLRFNLPIFLTLSRIVVIPLFILIAETYPLWGALVFAVASFTDLIDGYLARRSGQVTKFGIIFDPIADKFLVISALILLVEMGKVSVWIATIIIAREFLITGIRVVALSKDIVIKAEIAGKLKTTIQFIAIIFLVIGRSIPPSYIGGIDLFDVGGILIWIAVILGIASGIQYSVAFSKKFINMAQ